MKAGGCAPAADCECCPCQYASVTRQCDRARVAAAVSSGVSESPEGPMPCAKQP